MNTRPPERFDIQFDNWYAVLSNALFLSPSSAYVELDGDDVLVRMGWAFQARFPRSSIAVVAKDHSSPLSRGVHGFAGRWLVNGSAQGLVRIDLRPGQHGHVLGFPVRLQRLVVSVTQPAALAAALKASP